jgi:hypothetical protein
MSEQVQSIEKNRLVEEHLEGGARRSKRIAGMKKR